MILKSLLVFSALALAIDAAALQGDVNEDGVVNVADRVLLGEILAGRSPSCSAADIDADGTLSSADAEALLDLILGRAPFEDLGTVELPAAGGTVNTGELTVSCDSGDFAEDFNLSVASSARSFGYDHTDNSEVYRIEGIPYSSAGGLTISLPEVPARRSVGSTMVLVGQEVNASSSMGYDIAAQLYPATVVEGRWVVDLPVVEGPPSELAGDMPPTYRLFVQRVSGVESGQFNIATDPTRRAGIKLDLVTPVGTSEEAKQRVATALGNAAYIINNLGFDQSKRTSPVKIEVKKLDKGTCGLYQPSMVSLNWTHIDINENLVNNASNLSTLKRTIIHEYLHMVQAWYDPRSSFTQAKYNAPQLWIDEATAVWIEQFSESAGGGATSDYMASNAGEVMKGLHVNCTGLSWLNAAASTRAQDHGYGMSLMFQYLFDNGLCQPNRTLLNIYTKLAAGTAPENAFLDSVPDPAGWWDDMLIAYAGNEIGTPGVAFRKTFANRQKSITFSADMTQSESYERTLMRHDKFESSCTFVNWLHQKQESPERLLVAELIADDDQFALMAFQPEAGKDSACVLRQTGTQFGPFKGKYYTLMIDTMTTSAVSKVLRAGHYLMARRLVDSGADAALPVLNVWYVDQEVPITFTQGSIMKRYYTVNGHVQCSKMLKVERYSETAPPIITVEPSGVINLPVSLTIGSTADPDSYYTTLSYEVEVQHTRRDGSSTTENLGTISGENFAEDFTITMAEDDVQLVLVVNASEQINGAPSGYYFLGTNLIMGVAVRYDYMLESTPSQ